MCRCAVASPNRASAQGEKKTRAVRRAGSPWQAWAGCRARLRTRCRWVDLGVARSLRRSRSSRHCAHISSLAAAVDVDDAAETLATGDGAMRSRHAVAAGELAGHIQAASRATRRRQALIQRQERSVLSSQLVYGGRRCAPAAAARVPPAACGWPCGACAPGWSTSEASRAASGTSAEPGEALARLGSPEPASPAR